MMNKVIRAITHHLWQVLIPGSSKIKFFIRFTHNIRILKEACGIGILGSDHHLILLNPRLDRLFSSLTIIAVRNTHTSRFRFRAMLDHQCLFGQMDCPTAGTHWIGEIALGIRLNPEGTLPNML